MKDRAFLFCTEGFDVEQANIVLRRSAGFLSQKHSEVLLITAEFLDRLASSRDAEIARHKAFIDALAWVDQQEFRGRRRREKHSLGSKA